MSASAGFENAPQPDLISWRETIDHLLAARRSAEALRLIHVLLRHLPRYLPAYVQMLQTLWLLQRWQEGRVWAKRLLRADPSQEMAWAMLARAAEDAGKPTLAHRYWLLAFEQAPYNRTIRSGIVRTALGQVAPLALNQAALAALCKVSRQWQRARPLYAALCQEQPTRIDYHCGLLEATWQLHNVECALPLARSLINQEPNLLLGWLVSAQIGDEDDRALAQARLLSLDADGVYVTARYNSQTLFASTPPLRLSAQEVMLFKRIRETGREN